MVTADEQRALQLENAKADAQFWDRMADMYGGTATDHKGLPFLLAARRADPSLIQRDAIRAPHLRKQVKTFPLPQAGGKTYQTSLRDGHLQGRAFAGLPTPRERLFIASTHVAGNAPSFKANISVAVCPISPAFSRASSASLSAAMLHATILLRLWDVATGQQIGPAMKHDDDVRGAMLTKEGRAPVPQ
jgi:hypothetical protein